MARKRRQHAPGTAGRGNAPERNETDQAHGDAGESPRPRENLGDTAERVERLLEAPIANLGCRLLDVIFRHEGRWVLRLVIDKAPPAGGADGPDMQDAAVTLEDCGAVSEVAGRILDVEDPIPHAFALEVTSPGLFRALKVRKHFAQSLGKMARFTLAPDVLPERKERTLRATIAAVREDAVDFKLGEERVTVPLEAIRSARLDPDL